MQLKVINDRPACADDRLVLCSIELGQFLWKDLADVPSNKLTLLLQSTPLHERLVDRQITSPQIFDEKCGFRNVIEQLLDDGQLSRERGRSVRETFCKGEDV